MKLGWNKDPSKKYFCLVVENKGNTKKAKKQNGQLIQGKESEAFSGKEWHVNPKLAKWEVGMAIADCSWDGNGMVQRQKTRDQGRPLFFHTRARPQACSKKLWLVCFQGGQVLLEANLAQPWSNTGTHKFPHILEVVMGKLTRFLLHPPEAPQLLTLP